MGEVERRNQRYASSPVSLLQLNFERLWIREGEYALSAAVDYLNNGSVLVGPSYTAACLAGGQHISTLHGSTGRVSNRVEGAAISVSLGVDLNKIKFNSRDIFDGTVEYSKGYGKKYFTCGKLVLPFLSMVTICSM
jgi:hypothetical protein